jgi:hypothetical protein
MFRLSSHHSYVMALEDGGLATETCRGNIITKYIYLYTVCAFVGLSEQYRNIHGVQYIKFIFMHFLLPL